MGDVVGRPRRNYLPGEMVTVPDAVADACGLDLSIEVAELRAKIDAIERKITSMQDSIILLKRAAGVR